MNVPRFASTTGTAGSSPEEPRIVGEIASGARELRLVVLMALALVVSALFGWVAILSLANRGPIVCYVPEVKGGSAVPMESEFP